MDLQTYALIVIIFLVTLCSILFIHSKLRGGKSFEEIQAEKKQLADRLYGSNHGKPKKFNRKVNKKSKERKSKDRKDTEQESQNDSDAPSDSLSGGSNSSPTHITQKGHVSEPDTIQEESISAKKQLVNKRHQNRKNSGSKTSTSNILSTKIEPPVVNSVIPVETLNNFEEIVPKDDFEIKKQKEDATENIAKASKKDVKKGKNKKDSNSSPKIEVPVIENVVLEKELITEMLVQKDSPKNLPPKEKLNKKKKQENVVISQQLVVDHDDINVNSIMDLLGRADFTRSEIQILIDYLLNKQQDTITVNHSEWSDDIVQKLKKQFAEKEKLLIEEQEAAAGLHVKLREMRTEINNERVQHHYKIGNFVEELNAKKMEIQNMTQEIQFITDKFGSEKQALANQVQQLQTKLYQEKQSVAQEHTQKIQQLTETSNALTNENFSKNHIINDLQEKFHQFQNDTSTKIGEYEQKLQEYDIIIRQSENEMSLLNTENQRLRADIVFNEKSKEDNEKRCAMQKYDLEQLKVQLAEQSAKSNHLDDNSKVEIRNLQNALDSSKTELNLSRTEVNNTQARIDELTSQIGELKATLETYVVQQTKKVDELNSALLNYKTMVADKDSKLADYQHKLQSLTGKEDELFKQIAEYKDKNNPFVENLVQEQQIRTKQILERLFPEAPAGPTTYHHWIEHIASYIEQCNAKNKQIISANNSEINSTNHLNNSDCSTEDLILQNAKLQTTVDEYKTIVAETEGLLTNLEKKVKEQDTYWRNIVESKDSEIRSFKTSNADSI